MILDWILDARYHIRKDLLKAGIPEDKIDDCLQWAFGNDYSTIPIYKMDERWNERHGKLFILYGSDLIQEALRRIAKEYLKE